MSLGTPGVSSRSAASDGRCRAQVAGRQAVVIGYTRGAAGFCSGYRVVARISAANDSDEGGETIARCVLRGALGDLWPSIVATHDG